MTLFIKILAFTALVIGLLFSIPTRSVSHFDIADAYTETIEPIPELTPKEYLSKYAKLYGSNEDAIFDTVKCESNFSMNPKGYNDGGRAHGMGQFHLPTWQDFTEEMGEVLDIKSVHDQSKVIAWAFAHHKESHWTCYYLTH